MTHRGPLRWRCFPQRARPAPLREWLGEEKRGGGSRREDEGVRHPSGGRDTDGAAGLGARASVYDRAQFVFRLDRDEDLLLPEAPT